MTDNKNLTEHPDFVQENDKPAARTEVTIKFGKGLIGDPFTSKNGKELVEVKIPNADKSDTRPWESFVISPRMIHDNQFGKGVWMKLPEDGTTRLSRMAKAGMDEAGKPVWNPRDPNRFQLRAEDSDGILQRQNPQLCSVGSVRPQSAGYREQEFRTHC